MNSVFSHNLSDTNTITSSLRNSHCIICGTPFNTARVGKLYCSAKCKQFGYNHRDKVFQSQNISDTGINAKSQTFYLDEFRFYSKRQKMLKRHKELSKKERLSETYGSFKLTENEDSELYNLEMELEEELMTLNLNFYSDDVDHLIR